MSRLEAALHRATTGFVVEPPDPGAEEPEQEFPVEPVPAPERMLVRHETPGPHRVAVVDAPAGEQALDARFQTLNPAHAEKLVTSESLPASVREQFRRLGAMLHHAQAANGMKLLMVSSATPNEGKTLTATNIALTLSESYQRRVLLIDGDLRRPSLDHIFQVPSVFGLSEALTSEPERRAALIQISKQLWLLPAGKPNPDPMSALTSDRMRHLLVDAAASFDWVIIDTPPVGILTDANLLGSIVEAAVLVVRAGKTSAVEVQRAVQALGRDKILGVVLNQAEKRHSSEADSYYYSSYYSSKR
ncbi:MAG: CpsD/CapB family tyrosine-protein kinase [Acidobacteriota bacterium]